MLRLKRFRKTWIACFALSLSLAALMFFAPRLDWVGGATVQMDVAVLDAVTGKPVPAASITFRQEIGPAMSRPAHWPHYTTDDSGSARVAWLFGAGGKKHLFFRSGSVSYAGNCFVVEAAGYETLICSVSDHLGSGESLWRSKRAKKVTLRLTPCVE